MYTKEMYEEALQAVKNYSEAHQIELDKAVEAAKEGHRDFVRDSLLMWNPEWLPVLNLVRADIYYRCNVLSMSPDVQSLVVAAIYAGMPSKANAVIPGAHDHDLLKFVMSGGLLSISEYDKGGDTLLESAYSLNRAIESANNYRQSQTWQTLGKSQ